MSLNIYPQQGPHEEVMILGDRESILELYAACRTALSDGVSSAEFEASDGEGYKLLIMETDETDLHSPYYEHTEIYGAGGKDPIDVMGRDTYKQLMED